MIKVKKGKAMAFMAAFVVSAGISVPVAAIYDPNAPTTPSDGAHVLVMPIMPVDGVARAQRLIVNGVVLENAPVSYKDEQGNWMLPMRAVAEALGFTVTYRPEIKGADLQKGNLFTTIYFGKNSYFFNRVAPFELESAPIVHDGVTFVPPSFFARVLQQELVESEEEMIIGKDTRPIVLQATQGETFPIELEENASTGFAWSYTIEPDSGVSLVEEEVIAPETDVIGAPSLRRWTFQADEVGTYTLTFTSARSFEDESTEPADTLTYSLTVVEAAGVEDEAVEELTEEPAEEPTEE